MYSMSSTPLICCSSGAATVWETVSRCRTRIDRGDHHLGRDDLRILRDRQRAHRDQPASTMTIEITRGEDRTLDKELGDHGRALGFAADAGRVCVTEEVTWAPV